MDKEKMTSAIEAAINPIIQKGAGMNAAEIDIVSKAASALKNIKKIEYMQKQIDFMEHYANAPDCRTYQGVTSRGFYDDNGHSWRDKVIASLENTIKQLQS